MRIVYMGTPRFAVPPLQALVEAGHEVAGVVTRPDKPAGRGRALAQPAVRIAAVGMNLPVHQPPRVRDRGFLSLLADLAPDVIVVAAYGQILPPDVLRLPRLGCINIHASLLPRYRGAAPINWAIIRGERETGITIMQMDEGMDTGAILMQESIPIGPEDTAGSLAEKLSHLGAGMIVRALPLVAAGTLVPRQQDHGLATMAPLLTKEDGRIDWSRPARELHDRVRGLSPWPGAFTVLDGKTIKILESAPADGAGEPGRIAVPTPDDLVVGTGRGVLKILRLQPEGKRAMTAAEFLRGHRVVAGKKFETGSTKFQASNSPEAHNDHDLKQ